MKLFNILKRILDEPITIELKNGIIVHGILKNIDKKINIFLINAKRMDNEKKSTYIKNIAIRGNNVRYIIFPDWLNIDSLLYGESV
jgi:small nuclear ribonucleoprotein D1